MNRRHHIRQHAQGVGTVIMAIIVVAILVAVAYVAITVASRSDEYVPTLTLELSRRSSTQDYYRADTEMDVEDLNFLNYWYSASISDPGFPPGDHDLRLLITYDWYDEAGNPETGKLVDKTWENVGVHTDEMQEVTYTIELPPLKRPPPHRNNENAVLWVYVYWDGALLDRDRYTVNYAILEVYEG